MKYIFTNLRLLEHDIVSGRISFTEGMGYVPMEEKRRFLLRLNRLISEERRRGLPPERLTVLDSLDVLVTDSIAAGTPLSDAGAPNCPVSGGKVTGGRVAGGQVDDTVNWIL